MDKKDKEFMERALALAERGRGRTSPNPAVGAVIIRSGKVIGEGYHKEAGKPHAEIEAMLDAKRRGNSARLCGAAMYVTLEPCCHYGRTPPCTAALIESGIRRVIIAAKDANPRVDGKGISELRKGKIAVTLAGKEYSSRAQKLNEAYEKYIITGMPFVTSKAAISIDGKIACASGQSQRISSPQSVKYAHKLRAENDAILVGIGTILADNPQLTCRLPGRRGCDPLRVILDSDLKIPLSAKVFADSNAIVFTTFEANDAKKKSLRAKGVDVVEITTKKERISIKRVLERLSKKGISSVLIEGGGTINASAFSEGVVDKVSYSIAPLIIGGDDAISVVRGISPLRLDGAYHLKDVEIKQMGSDIIIEGYL